MQDTSVGSGVQVRFRPTWQQSFVRGLLLGIVGSVVAVLVNVAVAVLAAATTGSAGISAGAWTVLALAPPVIGAAFGVGFGRVFGTDVDAVGIRQVPGPDCYRWDRVVDLRAERYRGRTVVAVYFDGGGIVHLRAPYDGEFLAADPAFERKLFTLSHLWRSHRIGGVAG